MLWAVVAVIRECREQDNAYTGAQTRGSDSIAASLHKLRFCVTYEMRTIKWRRSLVAAVASTALLFLLCWRRVPTPRQLLTHVLIILGVYSAMWSHYAKCTSEDAVKYAVGNIDHIKQLLVQNHSFILPSWQIDHDA